MENDGLPPASHGLGRPGFNSLFFCIRKAGLGGRVGGPVRVRKIGMAASDSPAAGSALGTHCANARLECGRRLGRKCSLCA